jgi:hypothetical protein
VPALRLAPLKRRQPVKCVRINSRDHDSILVLALFFVCGLARWIEVGVAFLQAFLLDCGSLKPWKFQPFHLYSLLVLT